MKKLVAFTIAAAALAAAAAGETIVSHGVLGNSGEQGTDLVRFNTSGAPGMGVAFDRFGSLWDRGGDGVLNRYALDGRLLAQYSIPRGSDRNTDQVIVVGDILVLQVRHRLYTLPITSKPGTAAEPMDRTSACISYGTFNGRFASAADGAIVLIDPNTGDVQPVVNDVNPQWVELGPDGAVYAVVNWRMHKYVDGKEVADGWPKSSPGERPQLIDGFWYGHTWHGTIRRYTEQMEPAPGVVLGGASGSFIGHLDQNSELINGRGLAKIKDDLFAVSGFGGIMHLLEWDAGKRRMTIIRRIGAIQPCTGLALDRDGNVFYRAGAWKWNDLPTTPLEFGVNGPEGAGIGQAVMLDGRFMCAAGFVWGQPTIYSGRLDRHVRVERLGDRCSLGRGYIASAAYRANGKLLLLAVNAEGAGHALRIRPDGRFHSDEGPVIMAVAKDAGPFTSLAMKDDNTLLAAAGGAIIQFARDGADWKETRRWNSWGADNADAFGGSIWICADAGRLWVSDSANHRVLLFDLAAAPAAPISAFGGERGSGLESLDSPQVIAACGDRAVVFDAGNQRLMKLEVR